MLHLSWSICRGRWHSFILVLMDHGPWVYGMIWLIKIYIVHGHDPGIWPNCHFGPWSWSWQMEDFGPWSGKWVKIHGHDLKPLSIYWPAPLPPPTFNDFFGLCSRCESVTRRAIYQYYIAPFFLIKTSTIQFHLTRAFFVKIQSKIDFTVYSPIIMLYFKLKALSNLYVFCKKYYCLNLEKMEF